MSFSNNLLLDANPDTSPGAFLLSLVQLRYLPKCIHLVAEYGIANYVSRSTPTHYREIAEKTKLSESNLFRVMSYLASHGIFQQVDNDGNFIGTELSDLLRDDTPGSMRDFIRWQAGPHLDSTVMNMDQALKTGSEVFSLANGSEFYSFLEKNTDVQLTFDKAMSNFHAPLQAAVAQLYDFSKCRTILELAGGQGGLLKTILSRYPNVKMATLFEREAVLPNVMPELKSDPNLKDRFQAVSGDLLAGVEQTADIFIIAETMHNFNDQDATVILRHIANAMGRNGKNSRLLIIEPNNDEFTPNRPATIARTMDLLMMIAQDGKERSPAMWRELLSHAGLELTERPVIKIPPIFIVLECQLAL